MSATEKEPLLREIGRATPTKRLAMFRRLARALAGGRPIVQGSGVVTARARILWASGPRLPGHTLQATRCSSVSPLASRRQFSAAMTMLRRQVVRVIGTA